MNPCWRYEQFAFWASIVAFFGLLLEASLESHRPARDEPLYRNPEPIFPTCFGCVFSNRKDSRIM